MTPRWTLLNKIPKTLIFDIAKKSIWLYVGSIIGIVLSFLSTIIITNLITVDEVGTLGNFFLLSGVITFIISLNTSGFLINEYIKDKKSFKSMLSSNMSLTLIMTMIAFIFFMIAGSLIESILKISLPYQIYAVIYTFFLVTTSFLLYYYLAVRDTNGYALLDVMPKLLVFLALLYIFWMRLELEIHKLVLIYTISVGIVAIAALFILHKRTELRFFSLKKVDAARIMEFGLPLIPHTIGGILITSIDRLYLTNMVSLASVGLYFIGMRFAGMLSFFYESMSKAALPYLLEGLKYNTAEAKKKIVLFSYIWFASISVAGLLLIVASWAVIKYTLPDVYFESFYFTFWLVIALVFAGFTRILSIYVAHTGNTKPIAFRADFAGAIVNIALCPLFIIWLGGIGAAISTAISYFVAFVGYFYTVQKMWPMPWLWWKH